MNLHPQTRHLVRADAELELAFGTVVLVCVVTGTLTGADFTVPAAVLTSGAVAFLLAGASQLLYFISARRRVQVELAVGNVLTSVALVAWLIAVSGFSTAAVAIIAFVIVWKIAIGGAELGALTGPTRRRGDAVEISGHQGSLGIPPANSAQRGR